MQCVYNTQKQIAMNLRRIRIELMVSSQLIFMCMNQQLNHPSLEPSIQKTHATDSMREEHIYRCRRSMLLTTWNVANYNVCQIQKVQISKYNKFSRQVASRYIVTFDNQLSKFFINIKRVPICENQPIHPIIQPAKDIEKSEGQPHAII